MITGAIAHLDLSVERSLARELLPHGRLQTLVVGMCGRQRRLAPRQLILEWVSAT